MGLVLELELVVELVLELEQGLGLELLSEEGEGAAARTCSKSQMGVSLQLGGVTEGLVSKCENPSY